MFSLRLPFLTVALFVVAALAADDVVKLTKDNFADIIGKDGLVFIKFFAPWCGHCKSMAGAFQDVAAEMKGKAVLADLDATVEEDIAKKYNIEGFPTLKLFSNGEELTDYNGGRDKESMIKFIQRATLPPFTTIADKAAYKKFLSDHAGKHVVISAPLKGDDLVNFRKAAYSLRDAMPDNLEIAMADDIKSVDIEAFAIGDTYLLRVDSDGSRKSMKVVQSEGVTMEKFVKNAALPNFQEFTQENADIYTELDIPLIVGFFKNCQDEQCQALERIAKKNINNGKVTFVWADSVALESFVDYVDMKGAKIPICGYSFEGDARYMLPKDFKYSEAALESWVDDMIAGKVKPKLKSEPIPEKNEGPVYTVVGNNWKEIVEDPKKDVLIAQVVAWCQHCSKLKPIFKKVATVLAEAGIGHVKLAQMETGENDAPAEYKATGYPTMHLFKAGKEQKGMVFDGERTSKDIIEWLKKHSSEKIEFDTSTLGEDPEAAPEEGEEGEGEGEGEGEEDEDAEDDEAGAEEKEGVEEKEAGKEEL